MASQRILMTTMPRSISINPQALPLSVLVSPRLVDAGRLEGFPDWLDWTGRIAQQGLALTFECGGRTATVQVAVDGLRPDIWRALFNADTLVRQYSFPDYAGRTVFSYPVRLALSALKNVYQQAALDLALPEPDGPKDELGLGRRRALAAMLGGLEVAWDESEATARRQRQRDAIAQDGAAPGAYDPADLGPDGLILPARMPAPDSPEARIFKHQVAEPFAVFSHPPSGPALADLPPPDWNTTLDFHQALSALNNYPGLQRALGLAFDVDLPLELVPVAPGNTFATIAVTAVAPEAPWAIEPGLPRLETAVMHVELDGERMFLAAPRAMVDGAADIPASGLLALLPTRFGLAQVDVDGALHKASALAETMAALAGPAPLIPPHVTKFDPSVTLPALRSGGLSLFADGRAGALMRRLADAQSQNDALEAGQPVRPFGAEDLVRGYRLDVWDSGTQAWHSLHRRSARYAVADAAPFVVADEEGMLRLAATQASPDPKRTERADDLYLHEALARWSGWSLSAPMPGRHLSRFGDPQRALPPAGEEDQFMENEAPTPFKMSTEFRAAPGTLPRLRFGTRYRMRARVVDLAGNSLAPDDLLAERLARALALPPDPDGTAYLRYEPVAAPQLVVRDVLALTAPGSELERLVIRTFNSEAGLDGTAADLRGSDRHVVPARTSVELGERLGMFDDGAGKLIGSDAMYALIAQREKGEFAQTPAPVLVAGQQKTFPLEPAARLDQAPYLPDPLARGAALRDVPGMPAATSATVRPGVGTSGPVPYRALDDPKPRAGSALLVDFGADGDWQKMRPFRLALGDGARAPTWDPMDRVLTVFLPKGTTSIVPFSSWIGADDLKLMGAWEWLREYVEARAAMPSDPEDWDYEGAMTEVAHVLLRALEGGHWMLTPPRLLTLVHAVQQPIGVPRFTGIAVQHRSGPDPDPDAPPPLQTMPEAEPTPESEAAAVTAWRRPGALDTFLIGALEIHGASTEKVDLLAEWDDPLDDRALGPPGTQQRRMPVDQLPVDGLDEHVLHTREAGQRPVGYYVPGKDLVAFVQRGDALGHMAAGRAVSEDAAPRHYIGDTRHHLVRYSAVATSRFRDYFDPSLDFTRRSEAIEVSVPASARPLAPQVAFAVPLFGWQRQTSASLKHSTRFGSAVRIYLERGWYSSGAGELLGVVLFNYLEYRGIVERESWRPYITQWGIDPIWESARITSIPGSSNFIGQAAADEALTLEENIPLRPGGGRGVVDVVGYPVAFDPERDQWYCDIVLKPGSATYMPFVRLALARYQPHALRDAKLSRVVLADFIQLTPDRTAVVTADPAHPRRVSVTVSGPAPRGPAPAFSDAPPPDPLVGAATVITVTVQQRDPAIGTDLGWAAAPDDVASVLVASEGAVEGNPDLMLWSGRVEFAAEPPRDRFRLLIEEYEYVSSNYNVIEEVPDGPPRVRQPRRLIYAETILLGAELTEAPASPTTGEGNPAPPDQWPVPADASYGPFAGPPAMRPGTPDSLPDLAPAPDLNAVDGHVKLLQAMLNAAGALPASLVPLNIDGKFGGETESAVRSFQGSHLLPVTGSVGALDWHVLALAAPLPMLAQGVGEPGMQGPLVAALQRALNLAGAVPRLDPGGEFDAATAAALAAFQEQRSLAASGGTDPATWLALADARAEAEPSGSMLLTFAYDPALPEPITFVSREDVDTPAPESEPVDASVIGLACQVVELRDANDLPVYRRTLNNPFGLWAESFGEGEDGQGAVPFGAPSRAEPGILVLTLPRLANAVQVVFVGSPLDPERMYDGADVLARFNITDLT